jgi:hypothetical protein
MIISDLDIECLTIGEAKADTPLIIDPDRMLTDAIALQGLKPIGRRQAQISDGPRRIQLLQAHGCTPQNIARQLAGFARSEEAFGAGIGKRSDHERCKQNGYGCQGRAIGPLGVVLDRIAEEA